MDEFEVGQVVEVTLSKRGFTTKRELVEITDQGAEVLARLQPAPVWRGFLGVSSPRPPTVVGWPEPAILGSDLVEVEPVRTSSTSADLQLMLEGTLGRFVAYGQLGSMPGNTQPDEAEVDVRLAYRIGSFVELK